MRARNPEQPDDKGRGGPAVTVEALHQQLHVAIEAIESGEQWRSWLDFARRLHRYSFNNIILIWAQRPDATAVASYTTWRAVDRQVRRGEKALRVMAPIIRRAAVQGPDGKPLLGADGRPQRRPQIVGFRPAPVFDITQTDGPPIPAPPQPQLLTGSGAATLWAALAAEVTERGYQLKRRPAAELGGANGVTKLIEHEVWVRDDVDDAQAVKTLAHELAHVMLHTDPVAEPAEGRLAQCAGVREVEAESVAHLVLAAHQIDTAAYSFPYVATWAHPIAAAEHISLADIVTRTGDRVIKAAAQVINATTPATQQAAPAGEALAARVTAGATRTADLRNHALAGTLPPVNLDVLLGVLADSHDFFRRQIRQSWVPDYLTTRHMQDAIGSHELGYAPRSWTALTDHLRTLGYSDDHIAAAGMATPTRNGHLVDRFRDRLTIPLRNLDGHLVGFTASTAHTTPPQRTGPSTSTRPPPRCSARARRCTGSANTNAN